MLHSSACFISNEQLISRPAYSISMPESSCNSINVCHIHRQHMGAVTSVTCVNTFCANHLANDNDENNSVGDVSGDNDKCDGEDMVMNNIRITTTRGYCSTEVDNINDVYNGGDGDHCNDNDCSESNNCGRSADSISKRRVIRICDNERQRRRRKLVGNGEKQAPKKFETIKHFIGSFVLIVSAVQISTACPETISSICRCDDSHNGIVLKCSNTDGPQAVYILRANQINLGLIQQLEMQNSGLKHIPAGFFSGLFIKKLDLSHNNIASIDENSFLGMNNVLQELILQHNNLTQLPAKALIPLSALLRLDLSNNSFGDIEAEHALPSLSKLYDISLANNRICQVHKNAFEGIKYSIQAINLGRNCLKEVPAPAIRGFKQLMALHLHNNNITALGALSFMNLPLMNLLNLASNQISFIHKQTFLNVPSLRYLYLTRNRINDIRPHQFSSFEQLEMLDLTGNYLVELQEDSFSNLQNLRQLYLGENRIAGIQPRSFVNSSVVILILNSNRLTELQEGMFDGLAKLQQLALKDNQIRSIDQNSFYSNPSLAMIDLSNNELVDVPPSTFLAQLNLFLIDLSANKLLRTPYGAFSRRVKTVLLQENPLVCSERVHMLQQGVGIYIASSEDAICGLNKIPNQGSTNDSTDGINASPTSFTMDHGESESIREKQLPPKIQSIIRPMSNIDNEVNKPKDGVGGQDDNNNDKMIPLRPVNAPDIVQPVSPLLPPHTPNTAQLPAVPESQSSAVLGSEVRNQDMRRYGTDRMPEETEIQNKTTTEESNQFDTNVIYPFPVPFLKRPTKLPKAYLAAPASTPSEDSKSTNRQTSSEQTLPPSIVVADRIQESDRVTLAPEIDNNRIEKVSMENAKETQESGEQILFDLDNTERLERVAAPSVIILICLSTVAIVMAAVFIGLCIAKHRRLQTFRGSMTTDSAAAARTNAYVAAQLDMIYGTVQRNRHMSIPNRFEDGQPWIYAPTSYGSTGYYK